VTWLSAGHDLLIISSQRQHRAHADDLSMTDNDQTSTLDPDAPAAPPYAPPPVPAYAAAEPPSRPRFVDQVLGMRAVLAVALACVVLGGVGGAILGATTNGGDSGFGGRGPGGFPGGGPGQQGQFQQGQLPNQGQFQQGQLPNG
jgi:hypothetical protein